MRRPARRIKLSKKKKQLKKIFKLLQKNYDKYFENVQTPNFKGGRQVQTALCKLNSDIDRKKRAETRL